MENPKSDIFFWGSWGFPIWQVAMDTGRTHPPENTGSRLFSVCSLCRCAQCEIDFCYNNPQDRNVFPWCYTLKCIEFDIIFPGFPRIVVHFNWSLYPEPFPKVPTVGWRWNGLTRFEDHPFALHWRSTYPQNPMVSHHIVFFLVAGTPPLTCSDRTGGRSLGVRCFLAEGVGPCISTWGSHLDLPTKLRTVHKDLEISGKKNRYPKIINFSHQNFTHPVTVG